MYNYIQLYIKYVHIYIYIYIIFSRDTSQKLLKFKNCRLLIPFFKLLTKNFNREYPNFGSEISCTEKKNEKFDL